MGLWYDVVALAGANEKEGGSGGLDWILNTATRGALPQFKEALGVFTVAFFRPRRPRRPRKQKFPHLSVTAV